MSRRRKNIPSQRKKRGSQQSKSLGWLGTFIYYSVFAALLYVLVRYMQSLLQLSQSGYIDTPFNETVVDLDYSYRVDSSELATVDVTGVSSVLSQLAAYHQTELATFYVCQFAAELIAAVGKGVNAFLHPPFGPILYTLPLLNSLQHHILEALVTFFHRFDEINKGQQIFHSKTLLSAVQIRDKTRPWWSFFRTCADQNKGVFSADELYQTLCITRYLPKKGYQLAYCMYRTLQNTAGMFPFQRLMTLNSDLCRFPVIGQNNKSMLIAESVEAFAAGSKPSGTLFFNASADRVRRVKATITGLDVMANLTRIAGRLSH